MTARTVLGLTAALLLSATASASGGGARTPGIPQLQSPTRWWSRSWLSGKS